jgi:hypothetical protein
MTGGKQPHKKQQPEASKILLQRVIAVSFVAQAAIIGVKGNLDVLSGKSPLDVIPSMLAQGIELILKAHSTEKSLKERNRKSPSDE